MKKRLLLIFVHIMGLIMVVRAQSELEILRDIYSGIDSVLIEQYGGQRYCEIKDSLDFRFSLYLSADGRVDSCVYVERSNNDDLNENLVARIRNTLIDRNYSDYLVATGMPRSTATSVSIAHNPRITKYCDKAKTKSTDH